MSISSLNSDSDFSPREVLALIRQREIRAIDLRFTDFHGCTRHFTIPAERLTEDSFEQGFGVDASSLRGWQAIHESDMLVVPESRTCFVDPFMQNSLAMICNVRDPVTHQTYPRDPRNIARRAESYMMSTGLADRVLFGPAVEFFVFDKVRFDQKANEGFYFVDSQEGYWNRGSVDGGGNGYTLRRGEGYQPLPPADSLQELRSEAMLLLEESGIPVDCQNHGVASGGHCGISLRAQSLVRTADNLIRLKYLVRNLAARFDKTATFMPKPVWKDNGSGLHLHMSLWKGDEPLFAGSGYGGLSEMAMFAMGGILQHTPALLALCCPTTNSYKRLTPGFEAPVNLSYSYRNRSAAIRIPVHSGVESKRRFEFRCPDPSGNPYMSTAAVLMAMMDGIQNRIAPGQPLDKDLYDLAPEEKHGVLSTPATLADALNALEADHDFLLRGDVFSSDVIRAWIQHKREQDVNELNQRPHPYEFMMYFDA